MPSAGHVLRPAISRSTAEKNGPRKQGRMRPNGPWARCVARLAVCCVACAMLPEYASSQLTSNSILAPLPTGQLRCSRENGGGTVRLTAPLSRLRTWASDDPTSVGSQRRVTIYEDSLGQLQSYVEVVTALDAAGGTIVATVGVRLANGVPVAGSVNQGGSEMLARRAHAITGVDGNRASSAAASSDTTATTNDKSRRGRALTVAELAVVADNVRSIQSRCQ